jgi:effector-binding domain-containing protein
MPCVRLAVMIAAALLMAPPLPASAQQTVPSAPGSAPASDVFGEEVVLPERRIVYLSGSANWDGAYETIVDALKTVYDYLARERLVPAGPPMTIYTQTDDTGFDYQAAVPIAGEPKVPPQGDIRLGQAPSGKALRFVHRGSYDSMDMTYEAITNHLDERRIEAGDVFIEEYVTDPRTTPDERLIVTIYVPIR